MKTLLKIIITIILAGLLFYGLKYLTCREREITYTFAQNLGLREITAYNPADPNQTDDSPCYTAAGYICHTKNAIACPREIPLGKMVVIGGKDYICLDRLSQKYDHRFDIAVASKAEAKEWGVRVLEVVVK